MSLDRFHDDSLGKARAARIIAAVAESEDATNEDRLEALRLLRAARAELTLAEIVLIEQARRKPGKASWETIAGALGMSTRQGAETHYRRLSGGRTGEL